MKYLLIILLLTVPQWLTKAEMISLHCEESFYWTRILMSTANNVIVGVQGWALIKVGNNLLKNLK